jgi:hypothetical protein
MFTNESSRIVKDDMINFKGTRTAIITKYMLSAYDFANSQGGMFGCYTHALVHD